ncbi:hypothetical protein Aperf_G00000117417 [Anoplocephala perfoliata]
MPRQSPAHQTQQRFLRLFRFPTLSDEDSSSHLPPSNAVDRDSGGDNHPSGRRLVHHGFFKQANKSHRPEDSAHPDATTSNKMGNVHQKAGIFSSLRLACMSFSPDCRGEVFSKRASALYALIKVTAGPLKEPPFWCFFKHHHKNLRGFQSNYQRSKVDKTYRRSNSNLYQLELPDVFVMVDILNQVEVFISCLFVGLYGCLWSLESFTEAASANSLNNPCLIMMMMAAKLRLCAVAMEPFFPICSMNPSIIFQTFDKFRGD